MDASIDAKDCDIALKLKKFIIEERWNDIIVDGPQNYIYTFTDTFGEGGGSHMGKDDINLILGATYKVFDPIKAYG